LYYLLVPAGRVVRLPLVLKAWDVSDH